MDNTEKFFDKLPIILSLMKLSLLKKTLVKLFIPVVCANINFQNIVLFAIYFFKLSVALRLLIVVFKLICFFFIRLYLNKLITNKKNNIDLTRIKNDK